MCFKGSKNEHVLLLLIFYGKLMKHWKYIIFLIAYGEMLLAWKRLASLIKFLRIDFMDLLYYLKDLKMLYLDLWYLGKLIQNLFDKEGAWRLWEPCEYIGYYKGFCETTWNWTVFWFHVNCELFMFYPWAVTCDYLVITQLDTIVCMTLVY